MYKPYGFSKIDATDYAPDIKTLVLNQFLGVDFTRGEFITDNRRSPDAKNVIWGTNPYLFDTRNGKKRVFSSVLTDSSNAPLKCNGIHVFEHLNSDNETVQDVILHFGTKLYYVLESNLKNGGITPVEIDYTLNDSKTKSFMSEGRLFIVGGGKYTVVDTDVSDVFVANNVNYNSSDDPYEYSLSHIPTTVISRLPTGGGTAYEDINLLNTWRKNEFRSTYHSVEREESFTGDGQTTVFTLTGTDADWITQDEVVVKVNDVEMSQYTQYSINLSTKKITFVTAPAVPTQTGVPNIKVKYYTDNPNNRVYYTTYQLDSAPIDCRPVIIKYKHDGEWENYTGNYTVDYENGIITFADAPTPEVDGVDNIQITFSVSSGDTLTETDTFTGDGQTNVFYITPANPVIFGDDVVVKVNGTELTTSVTVDIIQKKITFDSAPASEAIITVTYNTILNTRDKVISNCTTFGIFGGSNDTRFFLTGNKDYPNTDWQSGLYDATYFPDTGYTKIGNDNAKIMGYIKQYDTQMIIKESNQQDGSAYLRTFSLDSDGKAYFPVEQGSVGIGAINKDTFAYLGSSPLFLSTDGVIRVSGSNVDNQRLMLNVSEKVNSKLIYENNLDGAVGIEFKDQYFLFVNTHCYVCDTRMQYKDSINVTEYEWMYWDNMRCQSVGKTNDYLLIGYNGMLWRMMNNDEYVQITGYTGNQIKKDESADGVFTDVIAHWTTPKLYLGGITAKKKLRDVFLMYGDRESIRANITAIFDGNRIIDLGSVSKLSGDRLDFRNVDFSQFTFGSYTSSNSTKIRVMLENFDCVSFKFETLSDVSSGSSNIGMDLFQITYNYKNR